MEVILYSKECNWYTRCCPLNGGVRYRECPLRETILYMYTIVAIVLLLTYLFIYLFIFYIRISLCVPLDAVQLMLVSMDKEMKVINNNNNK